MAVPPIPPPLAQLGRRPFSFYPAILNAGHNEWIYRSATWSDVLVRNTKTNEEVSVPRRYLGEISRVDAPVMIVGLRRNWSIDRGVVWPAERRVIEMPRAVNDAPRPGSAATAVTCPWWSESGWRAKAVRAWESWFSAAWRWAWPDACWRSACSAAVSLRRAPSMRRSPARIFRLTQRRRLRCGGACISGQPQAERWHSGGRARSRTIRTAGLSTAEAVRHLDGARSHGLQYIGAMDWNWHPVHAVDLAGLPISYPDAPPVAAVLTRLRS